MKLRRQEKIMNADEKLFYDLCEQYNLNYVMCAGDLYTVQDLVDLEYDDYSKSWLISYDNERQKLYIACDVERKVTLNDEPCLRYTGSEFFTMDSFKRLLKKYEKLTREVKKEIIERKKLEITSAGTNYDI
jgi:hypothetical protein